MNLVPAQCRLGLDIRVHPGFPAADILALLRSTIARHSPRARLTLHREGPPGVTPRTDPWARRLRSVGRGWAAADWFCDANIFAGAGIPAVAFGPGSIAQAHTKDEYIIERELNAGVDAYSRFIASVEAG
jgi:acetylornithine deacetylase/succinyl-diaminopimelate desuccinylase-like protein